MAVHTSKVTTLSNANLQLDPNGSGKVRLNKLAGNNTQPVAVDNNGDTKNLKVSDLTEKASPVSTDVIMVQTPTGTTVQKCTLAAAVGGVTGSIIPEAPTDGTFYSRSDNNGAYGSGSGTASWQRVIPYDITKLPTLP